MKELIKWIEVFLCSRVLLYGILAYYTGVLYNLTGYVPFGIMCILWFAAFLWRGLQLIVTIADKQNTDKL